jgi:hypothetical protein
MKMTHATISPSDFDGKWHDWTYLEHKTSQKDIGSHIDCDTTLSWLFTSCHTKERTTSQLDKNAEHVRGYED